MADPEQEYCFQCERFIEIKDDNQWCLVRLVDEFGEWVKNENGEELLAPVCLECGRELGALTVEEFRNLCLAAEKKDIQ